MKNKLSFESSIEELEGIVKKLEGGALTLDESLSAYERAITLVRFASEKLENAKQRVRILEQMQDGTIVDLPFDAQSDAT